MKLFIPTEPGEARTIPDARALASRVAYPGLYESSGLVVRFRFLHELVVPPEGLAVRPPLPSEPTLLELLAVWATALEGVVWRDGGQVQVFHAGREWSRVSGVEVTL